MRFSVYDTKTGSTRLHNIPVTSPNWANRINGNGRGSFTVPVKEFGMSAAWVRSLFQKRARMIGVDDGATVSHLGVIMTDSWDEASGMLTLNTYEMRSYWSWRMTAGVNNIANGDLKATGLSASGAIRRIIQRSTQWNGWELPIDLPADGTGNVVLDASWYQTRYLDDLVSEVEKTGVEVYLRPYLTGTGVRLEAVVAPAITGATLRLPAQAAKAALSKVQVKGDATRQVTGVLVTGNGSGSDLRTRWAGDAFAEGIPVADVLRNEPDVDDLNTLQSIANAEFAENREPVEQWSFSLQLDSDVTLNRVQIGSILNLESRRSLWIPDGQSTHRVIALQGSNTDTVQVEVQAHGS